jgi:hypothetical protein
MAVRAGCDLNCGCTYADLYEAAKEGLVSEAEIDASLRRLLRTRFRLGFFDPQELLPWSKLGFGIVDSKEHRALARKAAAESVVLLKNKGGLLPLRRDYGRVLVVGPTAANIGALVGNYYGMAPELVTIFQGIMEALDHNTPVKYRPGCPILSPQAPGENYTYPAAEMADIFIAVMGLDHTLEGEEGDSVASPSGGDRDSIELPQVQRGFLRELRRYCKKLILVLTGGSALAVTEEHEYCDAVLQVWYPGCEGGRGVADVLFGEVSPGGKMRSAFAGDRPPDLPPFNRLPLERLPHVPLRRRPGSRSTIRLRASATRASARRRCSFSSSDDAALSARPDPPSQTTGAYCRPRNRAVLLRCASHSICRMSPARASVAFDKGAGRAAVRARRRTSQLPTARGRLHGIRRPKASASALPANTGSWWVRPRRVRAPWNSAPPLRRPCGSASSRGRAACRASCSPDRKPGVTMPF